MAGKRKARELLDLPEAWAVLRELAVRRSGVLYRPEVVDRGVPRWVVQAEIRARRWTRTGRQTVVCHNGEITDAQRRAVVVLEVGPRAALDGLTALQHDGVDIRGDGSLHLIAPKGSTPKRPRGACVHESRRFDEADVVMRDGVRMVRPAVAAVHAALWAGSDREAKLCLIVVVQQRRGSVAQVEEALGKVRRAKRRAMLRGVLADLAGGVRSLNELDFARALRRRGLPEPDRQQVRTRPSGRQYLDCRFDRYRLTVEIDGPQHDQAEQRLSDTLRDLQLAAEGDDVVRIPSVSLRLDEDGVMAAFQRVLEARGWRGAA